MCKTIIDDDGDDDDENLLRSRLRVFNVVWGLDERTACLKHAV